MEASFTGRHISSRKVKGIKAWKPTWAQCHQTLNVKLGNLAFTRHSDSGMVTLADGTEMEGLLRSSVSRHAFLAVLDRADMVTGNLRCKIDKETVYEDLDPIHLLNDAGTYMHSTEKVLDELVKQSAEIASQAESGEPETCLVANDGHRQFCLSARKRVRCSPDMSVSPMLSPCCILEQTGHLSLSSNHIVDCSV